MDAIIRKAIQHKQKILIMYKGLPRVFEPHVYGAAKNGTTFIRGYQVGGESTSSDLGWRILDVNKIQAITLIENQYFENGRKGYAADPLITTVYAAIGTK